MQPEDRWEWESEGEGGLIDILASVSGGEWYGLSGVLVGGLRRQKGGSERLSATRQWTGWSMLHFH